MIKCELPMNCPECDEPWYRDDIGEYRERGVFARNRIYDCGLHLSAYHASDDSKSREIKIGCKNSNLRLKEWRNGN